MVDAVKPFVSRQVWTMIELQRLTGMRPGEVVAMRGRELNRGGKVWLYTPAQHKTRHRGHKRIVYLGPQAQEVLTPFLKLNPDACFFSPADAEAERREERAAARKTPLSTGNRPGTNRRRSPRKTPGERYTVESYGRAIKDACQWAFEMPGELRERRRDKAAEAKLPAAERDRLAKERADHAACRKAWRAENTWHPHQLRHNAATKWRATHGPEVALVLLGDKTTSMIDVYAEKDHATAQQVALMVG
jgi:integrase